MKADIMIHGMSERKGKVLVLIGHEKLGEQTEDLLVVGHMPFLGKLVALLTLGREEPSPVAFLPGSLVCLERGGEGAWAVVSMVRPVTY